MPPEALQNPGPFGLLNHGECLSGMNGADTQGHIPEYFRKEASQPEKDHRAELLIPATANNHFLSRRCHFLNQIGIGLHVPAGIGERLRMGNVQDDTLCLGFVKDAGRSHFQGNRIADPFSSIQGFGDISRHGEIGDRQPI